MLTNTLRYMFVLHSKNLVKSAMLLRPQHNRYKRLHPQRMQKLIRTTQPPQPLKYKIHQCSQQQSFSLPHPEALGLLEKLPFSVKRSISGNLPVYLDYKNNRNIQRTIIKNIEGNIEQLAKELKKVVSNQDVHIKVGRIQIPGIHRQSVNMLLYRLGF